MSAAQEGSRAVLAALAVMKLWQLDERDDFKARGEWDSYTGFIIRAETAERARALANETIDAGEDGRWLDPSRTSCVELPVQGLEGIQLGSFRAG